MFGLVHRHGHVGGSSYRVVPRKIPPKNRPLSCINFGRSEDQTIMVFQLFQGGQGGGQESDTCEPLAAACSTGFYPTLHPEELVPYKTLKWLSSWYLVFGMTGSMVLAVVLFVIFLRFKMMTVVSDTATDFYHRRERFSGLRPEIFPTRLHVISPITDVWSTIKPPNEVAESDRDGAKPSVKVKECYEPRRYNHCSPEDCDRAWLVTEVCRLQKNATASKTNGNAHGCPMILDISHQKTWPDTTCDRFMACLDELTKHIGHANKATGGEINRSLLKRLYVGSLRPDTIKYYLIDDLMEQIHDAEVVGGVQIDLRFCDIQDRLLAPQRNVLEEVLSLKYSDAMAELTGEEASRVNVKVHIIHESSSTNTDFFELNAKVQMYSKDFARRFEPPTDAATSETVMALLATLAIGWLCCVVSAMGGFGSNGEGPANAVAFWVTIIGVVGLAIYAVYRIPSSCYGREVPAKDATGTPKKKIWTRFGLTMLTVGLTGAWVACAIIAGLYIAEGDTNAGHGLMIVSIVLAVVWIAWLDISTWLFWTKSYPPDDDNKNQPDDDNKNQLNKVKEKKNSKLIEWQTGPDSRLRVTFEGVPTRIQQGQDNKKWHAAWLGRSVTSREQDVLKAFFRQRLENFIFVNGTKLKSKRGEAGLATLGRRRDSSVFKTTSEPGQTSSDWCRIDVHCFPNTVPRASCKLWFWWPPILVYGMGWESNHTEEVESDSEVREAITVDISLFRDYRSKDEVKEDGHIRKGFMKDFYRYLLASCEDSSDTAFGHHKHSFYMCHLLTDLADDVKTPDPIQYWKILLPVLTFVLADLVLTGAAGSDAVVESSLTWAAVVMLVLWGGMLLRSIGNDRKKEVQIITDAGAKPVTVDSLQSKLNAHSYEGDGWYVYSVLMTVFPIITITCIVLAVQDIGGDTVLVSTAIVFFAASVLTGLLRHCRHPRNKRDLWVKYGPRWLRMDGPILLFPLIILACVVLIVQDVGEAKTADRLTIAAVVFGLALGVAFVIRVYWHNSLFGETDESQSFQGYYNDPASQVGEWTRFNMYLLAFGAGEFFFALTTVLTVWWQTSIIDCIVLRHTSRDALCYDPTLEGYQCYNDFNMTASKDDTFQTDTEGDGFLGIIAAHYAHAMKDSADFISCEATDNFTAATCFLKYDFTFAAYLDNAGSAQGLFVFLTSSIAFLVAKMVFLFSKQYTIMRDTIVATTISTSALAAVGVWLIYSMQMRYSVYSVMLGIEIFGFVTFLMSRIAMLIWIQNLEDKLFRFGRPEYNGEDDDATQMRKAGLESADPTLKIFDNLGNTAQINSATEVDWLQSQTVRPLGANLHSSIDLEFHWNLDAIGATFTDGQVPRRKLGIPVHITLVGTRRSTAELHFMLNMGIGATFATIQISTKFLGRIIRVEVKFVNLLEGKPVAGFNPCWLDGDCTSFPEIKDEGPKMSDLTKVSGLCIPPSRQSLRCTEIALSFPGSDIPKPRTRFEICAGHRVCFSRSLW